MTMPWRWLIVILLLPGTGRGSWLEHLHPGLARSKAELTSVKQRLAELPLLPFNGTTPRLGFHSETMNAVDESLIIQLDLQGTFPVEQIALVPVGIPTGQGTANAYGFPAGLRVAASLHASFEESTVVADWRWSGGRYPVLIELEKTLARYVRIEITRHGALAGQWVSALGEILVFSARRNVALNCPATIVRGRTLNVPPAWSVAHLTDGESLLGPPTSGEASPTRGFRSTDTNQEPWVQVDLGRSFAVDEIRLAPARFAADSDTPGYGFPLRFEILAGYDESFGEYQVLSDRTKKDVPNPGENPFVLGVDGRQFRFIRLLVHKPWQRNRSPVFALSELQVFSESANVALNARVTASGIDAPGGDWNRRFLTDGYSSRHRLVDRIEQLTMLAERETLETRRDELEERQQRQLSQALTWVSLGGGGGVLALAAVIVALRMRQRRAAHHAAQRLRAQIAGDLHDDVGSNLGSIALLAQAGEKETASAADKFREIDRTARETAEPMRDIVWMLKSGNSNTHELIQQMRAVAKRTDKVAFTDNGASNKIDLPLDFTRQVFLIFKESLSNAHRHSHSEKIAAAVEISGGRLTFVVTDDGRGFDTASPSPGNGLGNLRDRAGAIGADLVIESVVARGTRIELRVPLPRS